MSSAYKLGTNHHGKGHVRILKVVRDGDRHSFLQMTIKVVLEVIHFYLGFNYT